MQYIILFWSAEGRYVYGVDKELYVGCHGTFSMLCLSRCVYIQTATSPRKLFMAGDRLDLP